MFSDFSSGVLEYRRGVVGFRSGIEDFRIGIREFRSVIAGLRIGIVGFRSGVVAVCASDLSTAMIHSRYLRVRQCTSSECLFDCNQMARRAA